MSLLEVGFWGCAAVVLYAFGLYPLLAGVRARLRSRPLQAKGPLPRSVSIVLAVHNEEMRVGRRAGELARLLTGAGLVGEVIVVSDGSDDATAAQARAVPGPVCVLELPERVGKAVALSRGVAAARSEVVAFADARQAWAPDALERLLDNFADPEVGAVSGDLVLLDGVGALAGVGLYWRFEKWLRRQESLAGSQVGVTGAISAVRRRLFQPIPAGTLLDDVYWPLRVVLAGGRVVHDARALAYDRLPERARDEYCRKVRTLAGNFQLVARLPEALLPWRNPAWLALVSHKLLRLLIPWALLGLLALGAVLPGWPYRLALIALTAGGVLGLFGLTACGARWRIASVAASFLVLNAAAWTAFWVWACGRAEQSWQKVAYTSPEAARLGEAGAAAALLAPSASERVTKGGETPPLPVGAGFPRPLSNLSLAVGPGPQDLHGV